MRSKPFIWITVSMLMVIGTLYAASAFEYFTYRMNFEPGTSENHIQEITFSGNLTISVPSGFSFVNSTANYTVSGSNYTWGGNTSATTVNYTISSPSSCTENDIYRSEIYNNGTFVDELIYVCLDDENIVDYKVEYGHGCGNYLAQNEPFISNESATLFNLVRVWNIGSYLDPDEDAQNATLTCFYPNYPVRTYGRAEIGYESTRINGSFLWDMIYGGYWFRIGVLSQDVSNKSTGDFYSVNCTDLTYDFEHERVVASFPNYSLEVRSTEPLIRNATVYGAKEVVTITNNEEYPLYNLILSFIVEGFIETNHWTRLGPGETVTYYADTGTNASVSFVPSWERHCFTQEYYTQILTNITSANATSNEAPASTDIPSQAWRENTTNNNTFDLDDYFSDPENDTLTFNYSGNVNITVTINSTTNQVSFSQPAGFTGIEYVTFSANDGNNTVYSNNVTLVVYPGNTTGNVTTITETIIQKGGKRKIYIYVPYNVTVNVTQEPEPGEPVCRELWLCSDWSECYPEARTNRTCKDLNNCDNTFFRPETRKECDYVPPPFEEVPSGQLEGQICKTCIIIPLILTLLFILLIIFILTEDKDKKHKNEVLKWKKIKVK